MAVDDPAAMPIREQITEIRYQGAWGVAGKLTQKHHAYWGSTMRRSFPREVVQMRSSKLPKAYHALATKE